MASSSHLDVCQKVAIELALQAGQMMLAASGRSRNIDQKESMVDLVTETDKGIEAMLFSEIKKKFPEHKTIGEESHHGKAEWTDEPTWIIDPVDGTMNFVHTFPFACVSIGLTIKKEPVLGVVFSPFLDKLYVGRKGRGSTCNGKPISVRACSGLSQALLVTELGSGREEDRIKAICDNFKAVAFKVHGIRAQGSAALNLCSVAHGYADGYYEFGLHCWDMCAGMIILTEAGGVVSDTTGSPLDIMARRILATGNQTVAQQLADSLVSHIELERD